MRACRLLASPFSKDCLISSQMLSPMLPVLPSRFLRFLLFGLLVLGGLLGPASSLQATHIVGGEMTYRCLGDDHYEIRLTVYRDCFNGVPYFDTSVAYVGIYNNGDLIDSLYMPFLMVDDTLDPVLSDSCLAVPPNVCVHTTYYLDTVELPPIPGGYNIVYQRCCRNYTISNIVGPDDTGATYSIHLTEEAMAVCNSSPRFTNWPPVYICADKPLDFDHSATDEDGDSIVYRLCTPFDGATDFDPRPIPSNQTVPMPVVWQAPYDLNNVMGGEPLAIDSATGLMTAVPNTLGQFVVGVCMEEYRDGQLLSVVRRDFQYNVGICGEPDAAFFAPDTICGFEVAFEDQSQSADSWLWYFEGLGNDAATSTEINPEYTYSDSGLYEVALVINPASVCSDTFTREVQIYPQTLNPNFFVPPLPTCSDTIELTTVNTSSDTQVDIVRYEWRLNRFPFDLITTDTSENFSYTFIDFNDRILLRLLVENERGCIDSTLRVADIKGLIDLPKNDTLTACQGDSIPINPGGNPAYEYQWSPTDFLSDPNAVNPVFTPPDSILETTFTVQILAVDTLKFADSIIGFDSCLVSRSVALQLAEKYPVTLPDSLISCADTAFSLSAFSPVALGYEWSDDELFQNILAQGPELTSSLPPGKQQRLYLRVDHGNGCRSVEEVLLVNASLDLSLPDVNGCTGDTLRLEPMESPAGYQMNYEWTTQQPVLDNQDTALVLLPDTLAPVQLLASNEWGCQDTARSEIEYGLAYPVSLSADSVLCELEPVLVSANSPVAEAYLWSLQPSLDPVADSTASLEVSLQFGEELLWYVGVDHGNGCVSVDSVRLENQGFILQVEDGNIDCLGDTLELSALSEPPQDPINWSWHQGPDILSSPDGSSILAAPASDTFYLVSGVNGAGCSATDTAFVEVVEEDLGLQVSAEPDTILNGESTQLLAQTSAVNPLFLWSPSFSLNFEDIPNPVASPAETTTYTVEVTSESGCLITRTVTVVVVDPPCIDPYVFFPNIFSPNGDGENDFLQVYGSFLDEVYFAVYNRWGEKVFEGFSKDDRWDGTYRGKPLSPDVYGYYLQVRCFNGELYQQKGNVTLLR